MLRCFVLVGAGGVAHAAPSCTYSRLAQATHTPTRRALPNQTASVPTGPEASGDVQQLEEHPLRHGGRGEAPCRIFFRALGPAAPLERGPAEGLENKTGFSVFLLDAKHGTTTDNPRWPSPFAEGSFEEMTDEGNVACVAVYGRKYRTLSSSYEPERGKRKVWPTSKQAFSNGATSKCGRMKEGQDGGGQKFDSPEGRSARRFFGHLPEGQDARNFFDGANVGCGSTTNCAIAGFGKQKSRALGYLPTR